ncbi:MAB_1171c family putative transporter [Amycolatopsis cihanbeyliensis]|uniref:DUF6545 domain-containing protein n=1 Tax=Amycolatopsis cihanbeyliensis TaxID=1128664 RepID=A0A542DF14_AMYCI|nr:MAB_1171c family putative transporter [Amycolatopsis cihanbeyliensis]TQJ01665.1 hypothetical protein FB471_1368 [Amycolatopsis cihanbeyliensis]
MTSIVYPVCAAVAVVAMLYRLRVLRRERSAAQWGLAGIYFFTACVWAVMLPGFWQPFSDVFGLPNVSGLIAQLAVILVVACQQIVLLHLSYNATTAQRKAVPRLCALCLALLIMIVLFIRAAEGMGQHPTDFAVTKAAVNPWYLTVYLTAYAVGQIDVARLCWRYRAIAPTVWLRRGLMVLVASVGILVIYLAGRFADIIAGLMGYTGHAWEPIVVIAVGSGSIVQLTAWILPDVGPRLSEAWAWLDRRRAYRQLLPLHDELTRHVPQVVLHVGGAPTRNDGAPAIYRHRNVDRRTRLYRLIVEIRDAQWALRVWMAPVVREAATQHAVAAGLRGDQAAAAIEAAQLRAALHAKTTHQQPSTHVSSPKTVEPEDLVAELAFQRKLARHFQPSAIVVAALATLTPTADVEPA